MKYIDSPFGFVLGKWADCVGGVWKGIYWVRARVNPTQKGTLAKYKLLKQGLITPEQFSYPQMNIRRIVFQVLGFIGKNNLSNLISPVWEALVKKRGLALTGTNMMIKRSAARLFATMTDSGLEFDPETNTIDVKEFLVSDGELESTPSITSAVYTAATGALVVAFDTGVFTNGSPDDFSFLMVLKKPLLESIGVTGTWYPEVFMYGSAVPLPPPGVPSVRSEGTITIDLPVDLDPADLTAYVFFRDELNEVGYSESLGLQVTAV